MTSGRWDYDVVDDLEASICEVLRSRGELGYTYEDELRQWLSDAGVEFDDRALGFALGHLGSLGGLQSPRPDHWEGPGARPTWYVAPRVHLG